MHIPYNDLKELLYAQESRLYKLLREFDNKDAELRSIYNTPFGKLIRKYKNFRKNLKLKKKAEKNNYQLWLKKYDTLTEKKKYRAIRAINVMKTQPRISIIMPLLKPSIPFLEQSIRSVQAQLYSNWELCITVDNIQNQEAYQLVKQYAAQDSRIICTVNNTEGSLAESNNAALELSSGAYFTILEHKDILCALALYYIALEINSYPESGLLYSDEDSINEHGERKDPFFKPDFNYELFLCQNMIGHLCAYKTSIVKAIGGFQKIYEGSEDYDLAFRVIEELKPEQIRHIPRIIYHKRVLETENSALLAIQQQTHATTLLAVNHHFKRRKIHAIAEASEDVPGCNRIRYTLPLQQPSVDIIIPTRNMAHLLRICILTILAKTTYKNYSITIIDNGSTEDATLSLLSQCQTDSRIRIIRDNETPFNYSKLNNRAVQSSAADYVCLMNNDIEIITPDWLNEMVGHAVQSGVGAVGARLWYPNATIQHAGVIIGIKTGTGHAHRHLRQGNQGYFGRGCLQQNFSAVTGACLLISRKNYLDIEGLNETEFMVGFNDIDLCLKLQEKGLRNIWAPNAEMFHHESVSRGRDNTPQKKERAKKELSNMQKRWANIIRHDPAYNPNLTIESEDFSLAWPPRITQERSYGGVSSGIFPEN